MRVKLLPNTAKCGKNRPRRVKSAVFIMRFKSIWEDDNYGRNKNTENRPTSVECVLFPLFDRFAGRGRHDTAPVHGNECRFPLDVG